MKAQMLILVMMVAAIQAKAQKTPSEKFATYSIPGHRSIFVGRIKPVPVVANTVRSKKYYILNPDETIVFYRTYEQRGKNTVAKHFFTKNGSSHMRPLTLKNLKEEFGGQQKFHAKLDVLARNNFQLVKYMGCVNRLYQNSLSDN